MTFQGKGFFIWKIGEAEAGNPHTVANLAAEAKFTHILIKIADGSGSYNIDRASGVDLAPPLAQALRAKGIKVMGWHYVYGYDPLGEADKAIQRIQQLHLDGYVIDAEAEYKEPGKDAAARQFMSRLRAALPDFPIALSSYRYPSYHPQLPWQAFLEKCDYNMPQVYWIQNHNPGEQLQRSLNEFQALTPYRPLIPVGAAFTEHRWSPTPNDVIEFLQSAQNLNLRAANFWEWSNCRAFLPEVWDAIKVYPWSTAPLPKDITQRYIDALNSHDVNEVIALYNPTAVHVTFARTIQGLDSIRIWYNSLLSQILPRAVFTLTGYSGTGSIRHLTWTATSSAGSVLNGSDTLGLANGRIAYHYSFFSVV